VPDEGGAGRDTAFGGLAKRVPGSSTELCQAGGTGRVQIRAVEPDRDTEPLMNPTIECPWCAEPTELGESSATEFHCPACATTVDLAPDAVGTSQLETALAA